MGVHSGLFTEDKNWKSFTWNKNSHTWSCYNQQPGSDWSRCLCVCVSVWKGNILSRKWLLSPNHHTTQADSLHLLFPQSWRARRDCFLCWFWTTSITLRQPTLTDWRGGEVVDKWREKVAILFPVDLSYMSVVHLNPSLQNQEKRKINAL